MRILRSCFLLLAIAIACHATSFAQAENVPVSHPVYDFLKRMEVKGHIVKYHDAILPLSRREVAQFLEALDQKQSSLTEREGSYLQRHISEFMYELNDTTSPPNSMIDGAGLSGYFSSLSDDRQRYLYALTDSNLTFFVNGLLNLDGRQITGDALGTKRVWFGQFGGRIRGTVFQKLGYYLHGTNAQFYGSRQLLQRDRFISQAYTLGVTNTKNFDFVEGYVRYDANIVSVQLGRERLLWGSGFDQKMIASDNVRVYDFIRGDV
ncbi:MAG: hypothetical protein AAB393_18400, partial [Bacteroidota bacterium]